MDQRDADTRAASRRLLAGDAGTQQRTRQAMRLLERALGEIRNFIGAFRPPGFERRALGEIIEGLAVQHETLTNQAVELQLPDDLGDCVLPTKIAIYRILQEGLANGHRHSGASRQRVSVARRGGADRKSTRLNSSHTVISYAVFCLKKK